MSWTDERVETLKKLWAEGHSASRIAAELGGITRNAVIGKVHRLGLSGRAKSPSSAAPRPRKPRAAAHMLRISRPSIRGNTALAHAFELDMEPEAQPIDNVIPIGQRRSLLELTEDTCRWPIGDPGSADFYQPAVLRLPFAGGLSARQCTPRPATVPRLEARCREKVTCVASISPRHRLRAHDIIGSWPVDAGALLAPQA